MFKASPKQTFNWGYQKFDENSIKIDLQLKLDWI